MRKHLLTLFLALASVISANAQSFEWGTATWNIEDGTEYNDIEEFNAAGLTLSYPNPTDYTLTMFNMVAVGFDLFVDDAPEPIKAVATSRASTDVLFDYPFAEGHKYKIVTTGSVLVQVNIATFSTDTLTTNTDSYQISFTIKGPELVQTIDVEGIMSLSIIDQEWSLTYSYVDPASILTPLGASSMDEVRVYGLNPNGSYNEHFMDYYYGWHDADGAFTTWSGGWDQFNGHNAYPAVYGMQLNETCDTVKYYFYDYWREYDPNEEEQTGGGVISTVNRRFAPETTYNSVIWDWQNEDGSTTQYRRNYRVNEGEDYKASFIFIANKKYVQLNATMHFVSQEAYEEFISGVNKVVSNDNGIEAIYDLNGVRQTSLKKGINIVKTSNGVKKVYVK
jgi:hypothetical protein